MRLSPVLATVVAIIPLGASLAENPQAPKNDIKIGRILSNNNSNRLFNKPLNRVIKITVSKLAFPINRLKVTSQNKISENISSKFFFQSKSGLVIPPKFKKIVQKKYDDLSDIPFQEKKFQNHTYARKTLNFQSISIVPNNQQTQINLANKQTTKPNIPNNSKTPQENTQEPETRVLVAEVLVKSTNGKLAQDLEKRVYSEIRTKPGITTTRSQLQEDINAIFATGFFSEVQAIPEDTPLGVQITFEVRTNPVLSTVKIETHTGTRVSSVLKPEVISEIFQSQYGKILNLQNFQEGLNELTRHYRANGYVLAQVVGLPKVSENGVVTIEIAEGVVESIIIRFRNKEGQETDDKGKTIKGRTQEYVIKRELELKSGQVFNRNIVQKDLQRLFRLGLFEDVSISLDPGDDTRKVNVVLKIVERRSGSIAAGAGISSASGLFGTLSYQEQNLNGRDQELGTELQAGQRELLFDVRFTDPWINGDPSRTSYTVNASRRSSISLVFDGPDDKDIKTINPNNMNDSGDRPRVVRLGGGVNFTRPLSGNPYKRSEWIASAKLQYQRVSIQDADGNLIEQGRVEGTANELLDLSKSGDGQDDLFLVRLGASRDLRNNSLQPTKGSFFRLSLDKSIPIGKGDISLTRFQGSYSQYIPIDFTNFIKGNVETLAFNLQGGAILGDLPTYEAFTLGGSNSVRGYEEGELSSGRSYLQASMEYRFPIFPVITGVLFADFGTDLGNTTKAAEMLNKNGTGFGYGVGVRVQSPLGPIRVDCSFNDTGNNRINFGIGERF
ncbi:BamA/TamA family outer membrane protein [Richelia intracellularis]|nr:BamA/TamA family outer membrane protein [Richelia intracellularis]